METPIKRKSRWTRVGKKKRSEYMRELAFKRQNKLSPEEKSAIGVKMSAYRWKDKKPLI